MTKAARFLYFSLFGLVILLFCLAIFVFGIYVLGWENKTVDSLVRFLPLPAAVVGGKLVTLANVNELADISQRLARKSTNFNFDSLEGQEFFSTQRKKILDRLIENKIICKLAAEEGISLSPEEINQYYLYLLSQFGMNAREAESWLKDYFNLSVGRFQDLIVAPALRRAKLEIVWFEKNRQSPAHERIKAAFEALEAGEDFGDVAVQYSEEGKSRYLGGEIGVFTKNQLPPWVVSKIFELETGQISEILATPQGYEIFQVMAKFPDKEQIQLRHILVNGPDFEKYLEERKKNFRVYVFEKI